jgi:hypothetical protein
MMPPSTIPLLVSLLVGFVLGVVTWGVLRLARRKEDAELASYDGVLLGLLALSAFALGAFLTYAFLAMEG